MAVSKVGSSNYVTRVKPGRFASQKKSSSGKWYQKLKTTKKWYELRNEGEPKKKWYELRNEGESAPKWYELPSSSKSIYTEA